ILPSLSTSPQVTPIEPKSPGPSTRACSRNEPFCWFTRSTPLPNSLMTNRSGQLSLLASSQTALKVERSPPSAPLAAAVSSNCQLPLLRNSRLPPLPPHLPSSHELVCDG